MSDGAGQLLKVFKPWKYQGIAIDFMADHPRCNLWAGMGMGKTVSALTLLHAVYNIVGESDPTLVLAPYRVAASTWPNEARRWQHLADLTVSAAVGTAEERLAALRKTAQVYTINYDNLPWLCDQFEGKPWPFKRVIADESTRLKSFRIRQGAVRAQRIGKHAHANVTGWVNLTGTPSPNGLKDLWGQQWFIDQGQRLGWTYSAFEQRWFAYRRERDAVTGRPDIKTVILPGADEQIHARLADCTLSLNPRDWFNIREPIQKVVEVDMPPAVWRKYRELERKYIAEIDGHQVDAVNAAAKSIKLLQLANGAVYYEEGKHVEVHDEKLEALASIIEEAAGAPVMVAYHFKPDLARLQRAFPKGRVLDKKPQTIDDWNAGRIPILFAHPQSAGHGLNLQDGGNILVFYSHWWDLEQHDQIIERLGPMRQLQAGHDQWVYIYYIVVRNTMDETVMERRTSKRSVQDLLLDYMRRRA